MTREKLRAFKCQPWWRALGFAGLLAVAVVSLIPVPAGIHGSDKLLHFVTYALLGLGFTSLCCTARQAVSTAVWVVLFGILIEFLQGFTGYRSFELADMLANSAGVTLAFLLWFTPVPVLLRQLERVIFGS